MSAKNETTIPQVTEYRAMRQGLTRRNNAALRLPPLSCGRRDPLGRAGDARVR